MYTLSEKSSTPNFINTLPNSDESESFYLARFGALSLVPLPLESETQRYFKGLSNEKELSKTNSIPFYRNYARSRVANSIIVGIGRTYSSANFEDVQSQYYLMDGRILFSSNNYKYHNKENKRGTFDTWRGWTASYVIGNKIDQPIGAPLQKQYLFHQIKGGSSFIGDLWITKNTYIGLHAYLETGVDIRNGQVGWLTSPSIGYQFLPFVGAKTRKFPKLATKLLQLLASQKWVASYQIITGRAPQLMIYSEFDINL